MAATIRTDKIGPVSGSADFTLPTADGSAKSALITDGSKVLSFATGTPSASNFLRGDGTWAAAGGGKILQVISATYSTEETTTSTTVVDTSLTATITPASASNKVMVFVCNAVRTGRNSSFATSGYVNSKFYIRRGVTTILDKYFTGDLGLGYTGAGQNVTVPLTLVHLDSPATTSATTYAYAHATYANWITYSCWNDIAATITSMEVEG